MLQEITAHLSPLPLGPIEFHPSVTSTNDLAAERLDSGSPDLTRRGRGVLKAEIGRLEGLLSAAELRTAEERP